MMYFLKRVDHPQVLRHIHGTACGNRPKWIKNHFSIDSEKEIIMKQTHH